MTSYKKHSTKFGLIALFTIPVICFAYLNASAQAITTTVPNEYFTAQISTNPDITTAPLFRSTSPTNITLTGYQSTADTTPVSGAYSCSFAGRTLQDRDSTSTAWTTFKTDVAYDPTSGCSSQFTKAERGNILNWSFRVTVKSNTDSTLTHDFFYEYAYTFQGAGVASGS